MCDGHLLAGLAALPGEVLRLQCETLPREAGGKARHRTQLQLGEASVARVRAGGTEEETGTASAAAASQRDAGNHAAIDGSKHAWFQDEHDYDQFGNRGAAITDRPEAFRRLLSMEYLDSLLFHLRRQNSS